jgi:bacteriorhodopsin
VTLNALQTTDIVGGTYSLALLGMMACAILLLLATGWVSRSWKLPIGLSAIVAIVAAAEYFEAREVWLAAKQVPIIYQYAGWMITIPVQVLALFFFVATAAAPSSALFWRLLVVAVITVLARYMGEAGFTHAALSFLIGIVGWLYILGECYFGRMNEIVVQSDDEVLQRGYFWLRLIVTIGWAIYPLCDFIANFGGGSDNGGRAVAYNLADFINRIAFALAILAVAMKASAPEGTAAGSSERGI